MKDAAEMFLDPLTGLYHRAYFMDRFSEASEVAQARSLALSLLLIDLDNLFLINLEKGRDSGDSALQALATTLKRSARPRDLVARLDGDRFAMLLPGTRLGTATQFASAIRRLVGRAHDVHPGIGAIDVCIGVAERPRGRSWQTLALLELADRRLNSAKRSRHRPGTPQQVWAGPPDPPDFDEDGEP